MFVEEIYIYDCQDYSNTLNLQIWHPDEPILIIKPSNGQKVVLDKCSIKELKEFLNKIEL